MAHMRHGDLNGGSSDAYVEWGRIGEILKKYNLQAGTKGCLGQKEAEFKGKFLQKKSDYGI